MREEPVEEILVFSFSSQYKEWSTETIIDKVGCLDANQKQQGE